MKSKTNMFKKIGKAAPAAADDDDDKAAAAAADVAIEMPVENSDDGGDEAGDDSTEKTSALSSLGAKLKSGVKAATHTVTDAVESAATVLGVHANSHDNDDDDDDDNGVKDKADKGGDAEEKGGADDGKSKKGAADTATKAAAADANDDDGDEGVEFKDGTEKQASKANPLMAMGAAMRSTAQAGFHAVGGAISQMTHLKNNDSDDDDDDDDEGFADGEEELLKSRARMTSSGVLGGGQSRFTWDLCMVFERGDADKEISLSLLTRAKKVNEVSSECSCDVHFYSLHSAHAKLTIKMQLRFYSANCSSAAAKKWSSPCERPVCTPCSTCRRPRSASLCR
jgi:hypothetical protein